MHQVTLSRLPLLAVCPGAVVLPWVSSRSTSAALGTALHVVQEIRTTDPGELDLDAIADVYNLDGADRGRFFATAIRCQPHIPAGGLAEVSLGYGCGAVNATPRPDASHVYDAPGASTCGTIDVMWSEPSPLETDGLCADGKHQDYEPCDICRRECPAGSVLWVVDYKTGVENNVPPIAKNIQLRVGALLAARWTGATRVIPAICFLEPPPEGVERGEGRWEVGEMLTAADLDAIESELVAILSAIESARLTAEVGALPSLTTGAHCAHCPARIACPAHLAEVRAMMPGGGPWISRVEAGELSAEEAAWIAERLPAIRGAIEKADAAVKAHVDAHGPIKLAGGKVYGKSEATNTEIDPVVAFAALNTVLESMPAALRAFDVSKTSIYDAVRELHDAAGIKRKLKSTVETVIAAIKAAGGITETKSVVYSARYPKALAADVPAELPPLGDLGPLED